MQLVTIQTPEELKQRLEAERARLRREAGLTPSEHFHRPMKERLLLKSAARLRFCSVDSPGSMKI